MHVLLLQLALEVGFTSVDVERYKHRKHSFVVACRGGNALKPIHLQETAQLVQSASVDGVIESKAEPRPLSRSATVTSGGAQIIMDAGRHLRTTERVVGRKHNQPWLLPVVTSTVVEEGRSRSKSKSHRMSKLQMFTQVSSVWLLS